MCLFVFATFSFIGSHGSTRPHGLRGFFYLQDRVSSFGQTTVVLRRTVATRGGPCTTQVRGEGVFGVRGGVVKLRTTCQEVCFVTGYAYQVVVRLTSRVDGRWVTT